MKLATLLPLALLPAALAATCDPCTGTLSACGAGEVCAVIGAATGAPSSLACVPGVASSLCKEGDNCASGASCAPAPGLNDGHSICGDALVGEEDGDGKCPAPYSRYRRKLCVPNSHLACKSDADCITGHCAGHGFCSCPAGGAKDEPAPAEKAAPAKAAPAEKPEAAAAPAEGGKEMGGEEAAVVEEGKKEGGDDATAKPAPVDADSATEESAEEDADSAAEKTKKKKKTAAGAVESDEPLDTDASTSGRASETPESDASCVDVAFLAGRGYAAGDMVHGGGVQRSVLCPGGGLPCGTEFHAVHVGGRVVGYGELCRTRACGEDVMDVDTLWADYGEARRGVDVGSGGTRLFMHDVRYPYAAQWALHAVMRAVRLVARGAVEKSAL